MTLPRKCHWWCPRALILHTGRASTFKHSHLPQCTFMPGLSLFARWTSEELLGFSHLYFVHTLQSNFMQRMQFYKLLIHIMNYNAYKHFFSCKYISEFSSICKIAINARLNKLLQGYFHSGESPSTLKRLSVCHPLWRGSTNPGPFLSILHILHGALTLN